MVLEPRFFFLLSIQQSAHLHVIAGNCGVHLEIFFSEILPNKSSFGCKGSFGEFSDPFDFKDEHSSLPVVFVHLDTMQQWVPPRDQLLLGFFFNKD